MGDVNSDPPLKFGTSSSFACQQLSEEALRPCNIIGTSPQTQNTTPPPRFLWGHGDFLQKEPKEIPAAHTIGAAIASPRIAGRIILWT